MGRASLTTRSRPPKFWPCTPWIAACACASLPISTKPKPLERPVSRSIMTLALPTEPYWLQVCVAKGIGQIAHVKFVAHEGLLKKHENAMEPDAINKPVTTSKTRD